MQIILNYFYIIIRMSKISSKQTLAIPNAAQDAGQLELLHYWWRFHFEKQFHSSKLNIYPTTYFSYSCVLPKRIEQLYSHKTYI